MSLYKITIKDSLKPPVEMYVVSDEPLSEIIKSVSMAHYPQAESIMAEKVAGALILLYKNGVWA